MNNKTLDTIITVLMVETHRKSVSVLTPDQAVLYSKLCGFLAGLDDDKEELTRFFEEANLDISELQRHTEKEKDDDELAMPSRTNCDKKEVFIKI